MKIKTLVEFSGVPKGTTGIAERDPDYENNWKVEWDLPLQLYGTKRKPLTDWFDEREFKKFLKVLGEKK